ncbi:MAG: pilus assembly protein CpaE, partial [Nakamurella sp.]
MISVELAGALKMAGLVWHPTSGDRFALITGAFDDEVFTLSDMVVEARESRTGTVLGFNGTTEWALDSAEATDALWLPREDQLRVLLGSSFRSLERVDEGYRVVA